uniref:Uncharacterized protein n=1 Tax=Rhizophora mucronata TaxID=61149 RepID=A0A2P2QKP0_RHIMU
MGSNHSTTCCKTCSFRVQANM